MPAAVAALAIAAAGLGAAHDGPAAGAVLAVGGAAAVAGRTGSPRARLWAAVALLAGLRMISQVQSAQSAARAWSAAAEAGDSGVVAASARLERVRESGPGRWRVQAELSGCPAPCAGAMASFDWREGPAPRVGERWRLSGRLSANSLRSAPGSRFPPPGLAPGARRGWLDEVRVETRGDRGVPLAGTAEAHLRERIARRFDGAPPGLVEALVLGDRGGIEPALADAFATSGTLHLLAVSGLHVGFLAATLGMALGLAGAGPRARASAATAVLAAYAILVGARPSVIRASTMAAAVLWARAGERRTSTWQAWGVAATALLALRPLDLFDLGFPLSFLAVAGLLALGGPWRAWLESGSDGRARPGAPAKALSAGLAATAAASVATLPVQAAAFGWVAPMGFAVNPPAVPLTGVALPLVWVALAADAVGLAPVAGPLATAASACLSLLGSLVLAGAGRSTVWVPGAAGWGAAAAGALAVAALTARRRPAGAGVAACAGLALLLAARPPAPPGWEVVWLDVGQGDAIAIHFPDGATWLVDAGGADPFGDAGRRVILPYLRRRGVGSLEWLVSTHPDLDHIGGAASVIRGMPVERWGSAGPSADSDAWLGVIAATGPRGRPAPHRLLAGERFRQGEVSIDVLHPPPEWVASDPYASRISANEASVVLLLSWRRCQVLLTGDLGDPGEARLVEALGDSLRADLLHAGHHGSRHSSTAPFLARVSPADAVASAGARNRFGHPHPDAVGRLVAAGARVHRTDRSGTLSARCGQDGWQVGGAAP